jgi:hypothetical protein
MTQHHKPQVTKAPKPTLAGTPRAKTAEEKAQPPLSPLAKALKERVRNQVEFDAESFLMAGTLASKQVVRMQQATVAELDAAQINAREYVAKRGEDSNSDRYDNARNAYIIADVCRDEKDQCIFPGGAFVLETMTPDEVGVLANLYFEVCRMQGPGCYEISDELVRDIAAICHAARDHDFPNTALARYVGSPSVPILKELIMRLSIQLVEAQQQLAKKPIEIEAEDFDPETTSVPS